MKNIKFSLAWQILFAMVLGILLGSYLHYHSDSRDWLVVNLLSPAGDIFIHLIKMIVVPICVPTWQSPAPPAHYPPRSAQYAPCRGYGQHQQ